MKLEARKRQREKTGGDDRERDTKNENKNLRLLPMVQSIPLKGSREQLKPLAVPAAGLGGMQGKQATPHLAPRRPAASELQGHCSLCLLSQQQPQEADRFPSECFLVPAAEFGGKG